MQFKKAYKQAIAAGTLTTSFRTWKSPQAKAGGQYNIPPYGAIEVDKVKTLTAASVTPAALGRAGLAKPEALYAALGITADQEIYQVDFHFLGDTPVKQIERSLLSPEEVKKILERLSRMDQTSPWTAKALQLIAQNPGTRTGDLAPGCGMETQVFKRNVRKLKAQGLTISLEVGYKLSPRGEQILESLSTATEKQ